MKPISSSDSYWGITTRAVPNGKLRSIAIIGPPKVGKTNFILRCCENDFERDYTPTLHDETFQKTVKIDHVNYICEILDTMGVENSMEMDLRDFMSSRATLGIDGYIYMYSIDDQQSFESLRGLHEILTTTLGGENEIPALLVGSKSDESAKQRQVSVASGIKLSRELKCCSFLECSALTGKGIDEAVTTLIDNMEKHLQKNIPNMFEDVTPEGSLQNQSRTNSENDQANCVLM